jgi:phosphoglycolate phosphatase-like HAD superfamily hydrolase
MPADALILFDIDGTLLRRAGPHHREALVTAVRAVTGLRTTTDGIPVHGMLDPDILSQMLARGGAPPGSIRRHLPEIMRRAQEVYCRCCPDLQTKTCPGVRTLLRRLRNRGVPASLVTGNLRRIGWKKMERAGLRRMFRSGAFAGMAPTRTALAAMAIREARREGWITGGARITLIGDAPPDVIAAKANSIRVVAVKTGLSSHEELAAQYPDLLLNDLTELTLEELL